MMELAITNSSKTLSVSDAIFGREFSEDLVHQVVVAYRNAGRAGTKAQKTRRKSTARPRSRRSRRAAVRVTAR
jgi:large subunit ribosomal protein L4